MGLLWVFCSGFLREIETHSGSVYTHSGCLCCKEVGAGGPAKHGALIGVFQLFYKGDRAIQWFRVYAVVVCVVRGKGGGAALLNMGT